MTVRGLAGSVVSWGAAGAVVVTGHIALAYWLMQTETPQIAGLPDPVYVELAPMPEAAAPLDEVETEEVAEIQPQEEEETGLTPPPLPDLSTLVPPPIDAVVLSRSERPRERPDRTEPEPEREVAKKEEPKRERRRQPEQQQQERRTRVDAPQSQRTAAPRANAGNAPTQRQSASWQAQVNSRVARHMQRTRLPGYRRSITVTVTFVISSNGQVTGARVGSSTGDPRVDQALNRQASRLRTLPPPPNGAQATLQLPVLINN